MKTIHRSVRLSERNAQLILSMGPTFAKGLERALEGAEMLLLIQAATIRELRGLFSERELKYLSVVVKDANVRGPLRMNPETLILIANAHDDNMPDDNNHGVSIILRLRSLTSGQSEAVFHMLETFQSK